MEFKKMMFVLQLANSRDILQGSPEKSGGCQPTSDGREMGTTPQQSRPYV